MLSLSRKNLCFDFTALTPLRACVVVWLGRALGTIGAEGCGLVDHQLIALARAYDSGAGGGLLCATHLATPNSALTADGCHFGLLLACFCTAQFLLLLLLFALAAAFHARGMMLPSPTH